MERGLGDKWESRAAFGYCTGVCVALHLPDGKHFVIGVDRDQPLPIAPDKQGRIAADLCLFAACAQDVAMRVLVPPEGSPESEIFPLTARELEALRWTTDGKTAWELGAILGISEQTAVRHLSNAPQKLGCVTKLQAAVKALRLGLIR